MLKLPNIKQGDVYATPRLASPQRIVTAECISIVGISGRVGDDSCLPLVRPQAALQRIERLGLDKVALLVLISIVLATKFMPPASPTGILVVSLR